MGAHKATGRTLLRSSPFELATPLKRGPGGDVFERTFNTHHTLQLLVREHSELVTKLRDQATVQRILDRLTQRTTPIFAEVLEEILGVKLNDLAPKRLDT